MSNEPFGCVKNTIRLRSGLYFDFLDPKPNQFMFADIAGALSKICRFGGQCDWFYSVAEHCYHCSRQAAKDGLSPEIQRAVLLHDAAEAFCGDMVKPLKIMMPEYSIVENRVEAVIAKKYGVDFSRDEVREIDLAMLIAERRQLFSPDKTIWTGENQVRILDINFLKLDPQAAERAFINRATAIGVDTN